VTTHTLAVCNTCSVDLTCHRAPPLGPNRCYLKTYTELGRQAAAEYERVGILRVLNWHAVSMPHNNTAALAEVLVPQEDMDDECY
jgi:hypothetical protein